jgi:hypothetical protein
MCCGEIAYYRAIAPEYERRHSIRGEWCVWNRRELPLFHVPQGDGRRFSHESG